MEKLENIIQGLNQEERSELLELIKKSFANEEITLLEEQLTTATQLVDRIALKNRISGLKQ